MANFMNNNKNQKTKNYKIYGAISAWLRKKQMSLTKIKIPSRKKKRQTKKKLKLFSSRRKKPYKIDDFNIIFQ